MIRILEDLSGDWRASFDIYQSSVSFFIVHHTEPIGLGTSHAGQSEGIRIFFLLGE